MKEKYRFLLYWGNNVDCRFKLTAGKWWEINQKQSRWMSIPDGEIKCAEFDVIEKLTARKSYDGSLLVWIKTRNALTTQSLNNLTKRKCISCCCPKRLSSLFWVSFLQVVIQQYRLSIGSVCHFKILLLQGTKWWIMWEKLVLQVGYIPSTHIPWWKLFICCQLNCKRNEIFLSCLESMPIYTVFATKGEEREKMRPESEAGAAWYRVL